MHFFRLKGTTFRINRCLSSSTKVEANTVIGNKLLDANNVKLDNDGWPVDDHHDEVVLRSSKQCLPLIRYDAKLQKAKEGREGIVNMTTHLQDILDEFFNGIQQIDGDGKPSATAASTGPDPPTSNRPSPFLDGFGCSSTSSALGGGNIKLSLPLASQMQPRHLPSPRLD